MNLEPKDLYEKLEFDKILELVEAECFGVLGKEVVREISPDTSKPNILRKLREVKEYQITLGNDPFPMRAYEEISQDLRMLEIEDYVLPIEGLQRINIILRSIHLIFKYFADSRQQVYPTLYSLIQPIIFDANLIKEIERVIDEEGQIKPDASPKLMKIRRTMGGKVKELDRQFRSVITKYRSNGWLTDNVESFRNGRRVLSAPAEHKRKIRGIIHDESTTGRTAFIEPEEIISINNDIFELEVEEKREIYRILKELSATLRPYAPSMYAYQTLLVRIDVIQAKARLSYRMNGTMPKVIGKPHMGIKRGFHPLLFLKNKELNKKTIPFDLILFQDNRILMLSGPNAGGKSITLKSVGLMQLMLQSGMLIPVDPISEMGIYEDIFADIGDQQSIEDELSTYSSRLANMKVFLEKATKRSLILIDEFGSGTDPQIGGAIAEAILGALNKKQVNGVITTHYSNLKIYAFKTKGIINGSMIFDKDTLSPTYELRVGRPGSSYAFEIGEKTGLDPKILNYARKKVGKKENAVETLLVNLQRDKQVLEEKLAVSEEKAKQLEKLIKNYDELHKNLEYRRKKQKLEAKEQALQNTAQDNRLLENWIRELKENEKLAEAEKLKKAKEIAKKVRIERKEIVEEVQELKEEIYYKPERTRSAKPIEVGDFVKLKTGGATGQVESIKKNKAVVQMGIMHMTVSVRDLQQAGEPLEIRRTKSIQVDTTAANAKFESKIDLRGMSKEEALAVLQEFVDQALIASVSNLEIIHGKGTGVLRKAVRRKLREYKDIQSIDFAPPERGGDGLTIVQL
ncbi:MAG: endonuclease MutS2 [Saprospiraceae bacterium]